MTHARNRTLAGLTGLLLTLLGSAAMAQTERPACFNLSDMGNHTVGDDKTLYVAVRHREVYRLDMAGACLNRANFGDPLVVEVFGGGDRICRPLDLNLSVLDGIGQSPCIVKKISRLSASQAAALPKKLRP